MAVASEEITSSLVRSLVSEQFPQWSELPIRPVDVQGWDNRTFRLGDRMAVRLPSADGYVAGLIREEQTLAILGSSLHVAIPRVVATGAPSTAFNRPWSVREWIEGHTLTAVATSERDSAIGGVGDALKVVEPAGHIVEVVQDENAGEPVSRVRLISPDADEALPQVMEALEGVEVRSVDIPKPSFDEVFFRLVQETKRKSG